MQVSKRPRPLNILNILILLLSKLFLFTARRKTTMSPQILSLHRGFFGVLCMLQGKILVSCMNMSEADLLYTQLLTDYNKKLLPVLNQSDETKVGIFLYIASINKFDELSGEFALTTLLNFTWREERMSWSPEEFGGKTTFLISPDDIWRPKIFVREAYDTFQDIGYRSDMLRITSDGIVVWTLGAVLKVICTVDVTFFPFDSQTCTVTLTTLAVRSEEIKFISLSSAVNMTFWEGNSQWTYQNTSISSYAYPQGPSGIKLHITLKRRSEFYIIYIMVPLIFLGKMNNLVFYIPANSGERSSVAITSFLSFAVYMQIINNSVPQSSAPIAYIYYYLLFLLIFSSYIMFACIVSMRIYNRKGEMSACTKRVVLFLTCSCCKSRKTRPNVHAAENDEHDKGSTVFSDQRNSDNQSAEREVTWALVGRTFDKYISIFNFIFFISISWGMFVCLYFNAEFIKSA